MPDLLGYRAKIGIVVPSTNTVMEPELHAMVPHGVTVHTARIYLPQSSIASPEEARSAVEAFQTALDVAIRDIATAEVDHLIIGVSALSFIGGLAGSRRFEERVKTTTTATITTAAAAIAEALRLYDVKRIGILSPHPAMLDRHYRQFFVESGYDVVTLHRFDCPTTLSIAMVEEATIRNALRNVSDRGVEAIVQVGTDLAMTRLADEAERWLGIPVLAVNAAALWHALRVCDIPDRLPQSGSILREHPPR
jgi:maleate isomerase